MIEYDITEMCGKLLSEKLGRIGTKKYFYNKQSPQEEDDIILKINHNFGHYIIFKFDNVDVEYYYKKHLMIYDENTSYKIPPLKKVIFTVQNLVIFKKPYVYINEENDSYKIPIILRNCLYDNRLTFDKEVKLKNCESF